ncbi:hypothetical protein AB0L74_29145 [Streptomyces sp. NPDC052020]|uniref:hypothetical protein n=1 Tax=Streptomyces sp. NPDC052020 TaxID=3155677 RepID=UPI003414C80B
MTLAVEIKNKQGGEIPNYPPQPSKKILKDAEDLIDSKKLDFASLWGSQGEITRGEFTRIDRQKPSKTHQNIQIQINNMQGGSTIAAVLIQLELGNVGSGDRETVLTFFKQALKASLGDKHIWQTDKA